MKDPSLLGGWGVVSTSFHPCLISLLPTIMSGSFGELATHPEFYRLHSSREQVVAFLGELPS